MPAKRVYTLALRKVYGFMLARGFESGALLAGTEISETDLAEPYHQVSEDQAREFYRNVVRLADSDGIGLEIGWTTGLADLGPMGLTQLAAKTVREAVTGSFSNRLIYNLLTNWSYEIVGDVMIHRSSVDEPDPALRIFLLERAFGTLQAHVEELVGSEARPIKVLLDYKAPANFRRYEEIFRCSIYFNQEFNEVHYPTRYLDVAIPTHDPQTHGVLDALQESLQQKLESRGDVVSDVKMALRRHPGVFPSLEQVADGLAMSSRTLRRKLGEHNLRFQDLLDAERRAVAEDLLATTGLSVQQIADQCGFNDAQNFAQAFKRWVGMSPSDYRKTQKGHE